MQLSLCPLWLLWLTKVIGIESIASGEPGVAVEALIGVVGGLPQSTDKRFDRGLSCRLEAVSLSEVEEAKGGRRHRAPRCGFRG